MDSASRKAKEMSSLLQSVLGEGSKMRQSTAIEIITPATARNWLETSIGNRGRQVGDKRIVDQRRVDDMVGIIKRGEWQVTNDALAFDEYGRLRNGHHRLSAIALSGIAVPMLVIRGVSDAAYYAMDRGGKRTLAQVLLERGEPYASNLAALANNAFKFAQGYGVSTRTHGVPSTAQALRFIDDNPGIRESVRVGTLVSQTVHASPLACSLAHFLISQVDVEAEEIEAFFEGLKNGEAMREGDPIFELRAYFLKGSARRHRDPLVMNTALIIKAWNLWRRGEKVSLLRWIGGGSRPEAFPEPI